MADVDVLADLLERWRAAGPIARVRVALDAQQHIATLSPTQKRALAVEVASRVAPQLVPQIEREDGDLSPEQVQALVDLLRRADDEDLGDLVDALRSGDVAPALALADEAMDVLVPPPPADEDEADDSVVAAGAGPAARHAAGVGPGAGPGTRPGSGTGDEPTPLRTGAGAAATALGAAGAARAGGGGDGPTPARGEVVATGERVGDRAGRSEPDMAGGPEDLDGTGDTDGPEDVERVGPTDGLGAADAALDAAEDRAEALEDALADEASLREQVEAAASSSDRWRESSPAATEPEYELPGTVFDLDAEDLPDTSVEVVETVLERAESDARDAAALRAGARPGPVAAAPQVVRDVPDGYRRRRVALQALRDGRLHDAEAVLDVVRALGRETDRTWVAGAALDLGVLTVEDLDRVVVGAAARARLARRGS